MKRLSSSAARRLGALALSALLLAGTPVSAWAAGGSQAVQTQQQEQQQALAAYYSGPMTLGGANTAQLPAAPVELTPEDALAALAGDQALSEENGLLSFLFGSGSTSNTITVKYLNVKGRGLRRNMRLNLVDCLVGITYTELGGIGSMAAVSDAAAAEAWKAQAIAIHSYLVYQNQSGSSANALIYTPVDQIPAATLRKMRAAISEVANTLLVYGSATGYQVCNAVFSASAGYNTYTGRYGTCAARDAWGSDVPYLQSVESPYERKYHDLFLGSYRPYTYTEYYDSQHPTEPYVSADTSHKSLGGFVLYNTLRVNGRSYRYIGQFVSSRYCFDFTQDAAGTNCMVYYGFGHGVGLSQCGAVGFAQERGYNYRQILQTYYPGAWLLQNGSAGGSAADIDSTPTAAEAPYAAVYDYSYYRAHNRDLQQRFGDDREQYLQYFLTTGMAQGDKGNASFNVFAYRFWNSDLRAQYGNDLAAYYMHYIQQGQAQRRITKWFIFF